MVPNRFLVIIAHPLHGRIKRLHIPHSALYVGSGLAVLAMIVAIGLGASYYKQTKAAERLGAQNVALQGEYDNLLLTIEERDRQLESLSSLAQQVSIAYGIRRDEEGAEIALGSDLEPVYHASLSQFEQLRTTLAGTDMGVPTSTMLVNRTPSIWPVKGRITSSFGSREDPFNGTGVFHPGIDISSTYGTPVVATADGFVVFAEWEGGLGHCVKILHGRNGFRTVYGHLKEYFVREGQRVRRGEVIGLLGNSGRTTGKHVHYEVHYNGLKVNPYKYLRNRERTYEMSLAD